MWPDHDSLYIFPYIYDPHLDMYTKWKRWFQQALCIYWCSLACNPVGLNPNTPPMQPPTPPRLHPYPQNVLFILQDVLMWEMKELADFSAQSLR